VFFTSKKYHQIPYNRNPVNDCPVVSVVASTIVIFICLVVRNRINIVVVVFVSNVLVDRKIIGTHAPEEDGHQ
jgi:hypothetical protein